MPFSATAFRVAIASPGDVLEERRVIRTVVHDWNAAHARTRGVVLLPVGWETDAPALLGARAQSIINTQVIDTADLLIAVFWTRLGTPTGAAASGTVEEIEKFLEAGKPVMLYFSNAPVVPASVDAEQYAAVIRFRSSCEQNGLVHRYDSVAELRERLARELALTINTHQAFAAASGSTDPSFSELPEPAAAERAIKDELSELTPEAVTVLREAAQDAGGTVLAIEFLAGYSVQTNGKSFVPDGSPRLAAAYKDAVLQLVELEYLRPVGFKGQVFELTSSGYAAADKLTLAASGGA